MPNPYHDRRGRFTTRSGGVGNTAYDVAKANGGVTISLAGDRPTEGYAYAPNKTTERRVPAGEFTPQHIDKYIDDHYDELSKPGNHLGMWVKGGQVYLDVSRVGSPSAATIAEAQRADQLGVFDLKTFKTITIGRMDRYGRYRPTGEAASLYDRHRRKVQRRDQS